MGRLNLGLTTANGKELQQARYWHRGIARAAIAGNKRPSELCKIFGLSPSHMTKVLQSPLVKMEMARLEADAEEAAMDMNKELQLREPAALAVIDEILGEEDEDGNPKASLAMRKDMALEILDRRGYGKSPAAQKHLHLHAHAEIKEASDEELDRRLTNLLEGDVIELTEEEIEEVTGSESGSTE